LLPLQLELLVRVRPASETLPRSHNKMDAQLKKEIADTIKKAVTIFTAQYSKAYLLQIVRLIKLEQNKKQTDWHLESRPVCAILKMHFVVVF
jgi:hypothetical protein